MLRRCIKLSEIVIKIHATSPNVCLQNEAIMIGPNKFACPYCSKIMKTNSDIKRHIRIHTGEKPYSCNVCHESFRLKCLLNIHIMKSH